MSYLQQIKQYALDNFNSEWQSEILLQVTKLRKMKFTYEWIYKALTYKQPKDWINNGFGLLWTQSYQKQITNYIQAEKAQLEGIDKDNLSWDMLEDDELEDSKSNRSMTDNLNTDQSTEKGLLNEIFGRGF